ncbi:WhiB family transcriptional regulator [Rhodococcus opacus]|nr:WhiB family transcriptional regulator [Rhodococcus opacus]
MEASPTSSASPDLAGTPCRHGVSAPTNTAPRKEFAPCRPCRQRNTKRRPQRGRDWRRQAGCCTADLTLFFHPVNERGPQRQRRIARAKRVCAHCPVLVQCRTHALTAREPFGIWGGTSEEERNTILGRGRSRLQAAASHCSA